MLAKLTCVIHPSLVVAGESSFRHALRTNSLTASFTACAFGSISSYSPSPSLEGGYGPARADAVLPLMSASLLPLRPPLATAADGGVEEDGTSTAVPMTMLVSVQPLRLR